MTPTRFADVKGFLPENEAAQLAAWARESAYLGPLLEIGSYCGLSTLWLAEVARESNTVVFAVDHHRGSEEHQVGEFFHDEVLTDERGRFDSLPEFRRNLQAHGAEDVVVQTPPARARDRRDVVHAVEHAARPVLDVAAAAGFDVGGEGKASAERR